MTLEAWKHFEEHSSLLSLDIHSNHTVDLNRLNPENPEIHHIEKYNNLLIPYIQLYHQQPLLFQQRFAQQLDSKQNKDNLKATRRILNVTMCVKHTWNSWYPTWLSAYDLTWFTFAPHMIQDVLRNLYKNMDS